MGFNEWFTIINTIVGIVGVIVGIAGGKSLHTAMKIRNSIKGAQGSTIQQAQIITNNTGMDEFAVIRLSRETTQEQLKEIVSKLTSVEEKVSNLPPASEIHVDRVEPTKPLKKNEIWGVFK